MGFVGRGEAERACRQLEATRPRCRCPTPCRTRPSRSSSGPRCPRTRPGMTWSPCMACVPRAPSSKQRWATTLEQPREHVDRALGCSCHQRGAPLHSRVDDVWPRGDRHGHGGVSKAGCATFVVLLRSRTVASSGTGWYVLTRCAARRERSGGCCTAAAAPSGVKLIHNTQTRHFRPWHQADHRQRTN